MTDTIIDYRINMKKILSFSLFALSMLSIVSSCDKEPNGGEKPPISEGKSQFQISFTGYERPSDLTVNISPQDKELTYFVTLDPKDYYYGPDAKGTPEEILQNDIYHIISLYEATFGHTVEEALEKMCRKGEATITRNNLIAKTDYTVLAAGLDNTGKIVTDVTNETFSTADITLSENTFTVTLTGIETKSITADVGVKNNDPYFMTCVIKEGYTTDEAYLNEIKGGDLSAFLNKGNTTGFTKEGLFPDTEYYFLVFGYEAGYPTTAITRQEFRTRPDASSTMSFEFIPEDIEAGYAEITVKPTPADATYYAYCVPADADEEFVRNYVEEEIQASISMGIIKDAIGYYKMTSLTGEDFITFYEAESGQSYKPFAFGVNTDTGEIITDIIFGDVFNVD